MAETVVTAQALRRNRLMLDIKELLETPYPNISFFIRDQDLSSACLVLTPENHTPLHLTMEFDQRYPNWPPIVRMNSDVVHPNVFGDFICATILKHGDEYTPAYTLKGIAIQLLSFFTSDKVEQDYGNRSVSLEKYRAARTDSYYNRPDSFNCSKCGFDARPLTYTIRDLRPSSTQEKRIISTKADTPMVVDRLPDELLLLIMEQLENFQDLVNFARAWPRVSHLMKAWDIIRQRELQCFCLKKTFKEVSLGVGVSLERGGQIASEFDLLSNEGFHRLGVRKSVHGLEFGHWMPLPISRRHWLRVRGSVAHHLADIKNGLLNRKISDAQLIQHFMNDVVVRLNLVASETHNKRRHNGQLNAKSSLRHASEKAIESYFHLFHLLLCIATQQPRVVAEANTLLRGFVNGKRSKADCPNLGHLLVALLISDIQVNDDLIKSIVTEAITRNVVWLLDRKGSGMPELSFLETDPVSEYRLKRTFEGSRTSYRLLMFSELFRRTARPAGTTSSKSLVQIRNELFDRHGAPPRGVAAHLAAEVRRLHKVNDFPTFIREMGIRYIPTAENFTAVLRKTVTASMDNGYSRWAISQNEAAVLRQRVEPQVGMSSAVTEWLREGPWKNVDNAAGRSWFPGNSDRRHDRSSRGRGGMRGRGHGARGRGRGQY